MRRGGRRGGGREGGRGEGGREGRERERGEESMVPDTVPERNILRYCKKPNSCTGVDSTFVLLAISLAETAGVALLGTEASSSFFFSSVFSAFTPSNSFLASSCSVRNLRPTSRS